MLTPQEGFVKLQDKRYASKNLEFLKPVYEQLYKGLGRHIVYEKELFKEVEVLKDFFKTAYAIKKEANLGSSDVPKFLDLLVRKNILQPIVISLQKILSVLVAKRTNKNGLEALLWLILGCTTMESLESLRNNPTLLSERLLSTEVLTTILNTDYLFFDIALLNILSPFELKDPTKRKGSFDKIIFARIASLLGLSDSFNPTSTNWLINEDGVMKIEAFPLPEGAKFPDFICKIKDMCFIGAHKEQNQAGGAQDNQAEDAKRVFLYSEPRYKDKLKVLLKSDTIKMVIIYDSYIEGLRTGYHWQSIYEKIKQSSEHYLVNSVIFIELLKSC